MEGSHDELTIAHCMFEKSISEHKVLPTPPPSYRRKAKGCPVIPSCLSLLPEPTQPSAGFRRHSVLWDEDSAAKAPWLCWLRGIRFRV